MSTHLTPSATPRSAADPGHHEAEPQLEHTTAQRIFEHRRILRMSPAAYDAAITLLANAASPLDPIAVVGIANGGMTPATDLAAHLTVPVHRVNARHNASNDIHLQATGHVLYDLSPLEATLQQPSHPGPDRPDGLDGPVPRSGTVLVVDDICGTGATFTAVVPALLTRLRAHFGPDIHARTVSLCRNAGAADGLDLWTWLVDDWVLFPWEPPPTTTIPVQDLPLPQALNPTQIAQTGVEPEPEPGTTDQDEVTQ